MKKLTQKHICMIPLMVWFVIIPIIVKLKFFPNPLLEYPWYSVDATLSDFFLYYKSMAVTITGVLMLGLLAWQIGKMRRKDTLFQPDTKIFIPLVIYTVLVIFSTLFSKYKYFSIHGMPDQFETIWNLLAYVLVVFYCYYVIVYHNSEKQVLTCIFAGVLLVGLICVLQYFKLDIYRWIYAGDGYTFTFAEGVVYGPFYNINYVGYYTLLFAPLFILLTILYKNWKVRIASAVLTIMLLITMLGAGSITAEIAFLGVAGFAVLFVLLKNVKTKKVLWIPIAALVVACVAVGVFAAPRVAAYVKASDTEKTNLENIYTRDDHVEIDYKGNKLFIDMQEEGGAVAFHLTDQNGQDVACEYAISAEDYYYYNITDERFAGLTVTPTLLSQEPEIYGFIVFIDDKNWCFTNQMTDDGTYVYYTDQGNVTKLTEENVSADFTPLVNKSSLANGRGYIWNKTIMLLKDYILFGSGADTYALAYPNGDYVDKYNNGYDNLILTKPHNLYLQIGVQTGVLSLICYLVFYLWYFVSSVRLYFRRRLDDPQVLVGFAVMLGTMGYMISGLANDSTITISPLYWALMGIGIGINHKIRTAANE